MLKNPELHPQVWHIWCSGALLWCQSMQTYNLHTKQTTKSALKRSSVPSWFAFMLVYMTTIPEELALFPIKMDVHLRRSWDEKVNVSLARTDLHGTFQTRPKISSLTQFTQRTLFQSQRELPRTGTCRQQHLCYSWPGPFRKFAFMQLCQPRDNGRCLL